MSFNTFIKQTEVNSGGGIRISVYKQSFGPDGDLVNELPHQITVGPFDDFDAIIAANNAHLQALGFPAIDPRELTLPAQLRAAAHGHPAVKDRIQIEAKRLAEKLAEEERQAAAEKANAEKLAADKAQEAKAHAAVLADIAAKEAARQAAQAQAIGEAIKAEVAKHMAALAKGEAKS
jgi:hypothetical protein